ncbi:MULTISPECIES: PH domain-containing protein [Aeromicrobium]|uniref:PH domain-containing protein n=1 Tax=Aeromicrobium piscarium TaxID=2590901 RepID=A0A554SGU3_9ACTN|nr:MULTISPECIES: PH domain-containing protein [Aeromicrobium]TSD65564.1 PH domain-containing protein [Aeromicrobium piscarium]
MFAWLLRMLEQEVEHHLLDDEGEHVIDLVRKHWVVYVLPSIGGLFAVFLIYVAVAVVPVGAGWFFLLLSLGVAGWAGYIAAREYRDIFVVTNMRVFRASGVFTVKIATMPITRILDITVEKPVIGRVLGYGHFVFESAARSQGLRKIRYISDPDGRDLTIQRVVQRSGLRGPRNPTAFH